MEHSNSDIKKEKVDKFLDEIWRSSTKNPIITFVGNNGGGKSRTLATLASRWRNYHRETARENNSIQNSTLPNMDESCVIKKNNFERVIVISNVLTDPFIAPRKPENEYRYLGVRGGVANAIHIGSLRRIGAQSFFKLETKKDREYLFNIIKNATGFTKPKIISRKYPKFNRDPKKSHNPRYASFDELIYEFEKHSRFPGDGLTKSEFSKYYLDLTKDDIDRIIDFYHFLYKKNNIRQNEFSFFDRFYEVFSSFSGLNFELTYSDDYVNGISGMSAGEENYLTLLLRVAAYAENNTLLLIDEPENGLHPQWQQDFVPVIRKLVDKYENCSVVIATHSAFIVGDAGSVIRFDKQKNPRLINYTPSDYSIDEIYYQFFSARLFSSADIEKYLKLVISWISEHSLALPPLEVQKAVSKLELLDKQSSPTLNSLLNQYHEVLKKVKI